MTVIALRVQGNEQVEIAADGRVMAQDIITDDVSKKIYELSNGLIIGCAGWTEIIELFILFMEKNIKSTAIPKWLTRKAYIGLLEEFHVEKGISIVDNVCYLTTLLINPFTNQVLKSMAINCQIITIDFAAIGSGSQIALGALEMGANPQEAVKIACKYIPECGGTCQIETVHFNKEAKL